MIPFHHSPKKSAVFACPP